MLAQPIQSVPKSLYGMVTNSSNCVFLKLVYIIDGQLQYEKSDELLMEKQSDRTRILQILKQIGAICR